MTRVAVVGAVGAGKTSLARVLSVRLQAPHVELDALRFGPKWQERPPSERARLLSSQLSLSDWVVDGHDETLRDAVWLNADVIVWLDYPLRVSLGRLLRRTLERLWAASRLPGGASEQWLRTLGPRSVVWWAIRSHRRRRAELHALLQKERYRHLKVIRLQEPAELERVLARVTEAITDLDRSRS